MRRLDEQRAPVHEPGQRVAHPECRDIVERDEIHVVELRVEPDRRVGDREVVGRRKALLLGAVLRIRLHVLAEQLADERRDELVRRDRTESADGMAPQGERAGRPKIDRSRHQGQWVPDPQYRVVAFTLAMDSQPVEDSHEVAGRDVARSEARRHGQDPRHEDPLGGGGVERRLRLAGEWVVGGSGLIGPFHDPDRPRLPEDR